MDLLSSQFVGLVWEHLGIIAGSLALLLMASMQGLILKWRQQSKDDRLLAHEAHSGMVHLESIIKRQSEQLTELIEACKNLKDDHATVQAMLSLLVTRGPQDIQKALHDLSIEIAGLKR